MTNMRRSKKDVVISKISGDDDPSVCDYLYDQSNDSFYIVDDLTYGMCRIVTYYLNRYLTEEPETGSVTIYINSNGGYASVSFGICETILKLRQSGIEVNTVAMGACMSGGVDIFLSGKNRLISRSCFFLIHNTKIVTGASGESVDELKKEGVMYGVLNREMYKTILADTKITVAEFEKKVKQEKEWFLTPKQVMALGFATGYYTDSVSVTNRKKSKK